jgi:hypothetical protein
VLAEEENLNVAAHVTQNADRVLKLPPVYADKMTNSQAYYDKLNASCSSNSDDSSSADECVDRQSMDEHIYMKRNSVAEASVNNRNLSVNAKDEVNEAAATTSSEIRTVLELNSNQIFIGMISTQYKAKIVIEIY